jgi:DNA-binding GntR family transcriptional regulator
VHEVFTVMEGLETVAAREASSRLDAGHQGMLTDLLSVMDEAVRTEAYAEWSTLNSRFHLAISAITEMPLLRDMTERALGQWDRIRRHFFEGVLVHRVVTAQREHHELYEAMKARDIEAIEEVVRRHNQGAMQDYTQFIQRSEGA